MLPHTAASKGGLEVPLVNHVISLVGKLCYMRLSLVEMRKLIHHGAITDYVALVYLIFKKVQLLVPFSHWWKHRGENMPQ